MLQYTHMQKLFTFPENFHFGAATASHQIEGGQDNNWTRFEHANAERLARESEASFRWNPHWSKFKEEATNPENYISGAACDHWNRYEEDFDILVSLGLNSYRFSIEWSRVEPGEGIFSEEALDHYEAMLIALQKRGITPFVTLWHWTLPLWLADQGGLTNNDFPYHFERYTQKVVNRLGKYVRFWITLNEPDVVASHSYLIGHWPPQKKNPLAYLKAERMLVQAHKQSYQMLKAYNKDNQIGIAKHQVAFVMLRPTLTNRILKFLADQFWNRPWLRKIKHYQDFIGLNHYHRHCIDNGYNKNPNLIQTDFGWEYCPESLTQALIELKPYKLPIYITENGVADANDKLRQDFIPRALKAVARGIEAGADVRGYLHWSFLDNFEWDKGFWLRFGLIQVDLKTQTRTIRQSARLYAEISQKRQIEL
jgi:beta-glucosidase